MKFVRLIFVLGALAATILVLGCSSAVTPTPIVVSRPTLENSPTLHPDATPVPELPTALAPTVSLGETRTYGDAFAGFALDYPAGWTVTDVKPEVKETSYIYAITLHSYTPGVGGSEGVPKGESKIDVGVIRTGAKNLEQAVAQRKQELAQNDSTTKIASEQSWTLGDLEAMRWELQAADGERIPEVVFALKDRTILIDGYGDTAFFDAIVQSLHAL